MDRDRLNFRAKDESRTHLAIVEWFFPKPITADNDRVPTLVINSKGKHAFYSIE